MGDADTDTTDLYGRTRGQRRAANSRVNVDQLLARERSRRRRRRDMLAPRRGPYAQGRPRTRAALRAGRRRGRRPQEPQVPEILQEAVPVVAAEAQEQNLYKQLLNLLPPERQRQWNNLSDVEKAGLKEWCIQFDVDIPVADVVPVEEEDAIEGGRRKRRRKKRTKKKSRKKKRRTKKRRKKKKRKTRR